MITSIFFGFIKSYWKALLPIILIGLMYWYVQHLQSSRDFWKSSYEGAINGYQSEVKLKAEKDRLRDEASNKNNKKADDEHKNQLAALFIDGQKERDALKAKLTKELEIKNANEKLLSMRLYAAYDRVSINSVDGAARRTTTSEAEHTEATRERDGTDTYTRTLERACAVTTSDFNRCSQWIEDLCELWKCGK
ncbi:MAG: hypothetical protein WC733_00185 [Methylophilus sp.]|jgi:hypothetical protein